MTILLSLLNDPTVQQAIIASVIAAILWVSKTVRAFANKNLKAKDRQAILDIARRAVLVAEQTGIGKVAAEKKAEAMRVAQVYLDAQNIKIDLAVVDAAIEAAVYEDINQFKSPLPDVRTDAAVGPQE